MSEKLTKKELAEKLGISRPTLDKYLEEGFPCKMTNKIVEYQPVIDNEYEKILIENEIRIMEYKLNKLKEKLNDLK